MTHLALELSQLELLGERLARPVCRSDGRCTPGGTAVHGVELADVRVGVACACESASGSVRQSRPSWTTRGISVLTEGNENHLCKGQLQAQRGGGG
jgi:hypothetical protein